MALPELDPDLHEVEAARFVNGFLIQALDEGASRIHVEPTAECLRIRAKVVGVWHDLSTAPLSIAAAVTTRLKGMADMDTTSPHPQGGQIAVSVDGKAKPVVIHASALPTIHGEEIVMRVLP